MNRDRRPTPKWDVVVLKRTNNYIEIETTESGLEEARHYGTLTPLSGSKIRYQLVVSELYDPGDVGEFLHQLDLSYRRSPEEVATLVEKVRNEG